MVGSIYLGSVLVLTVLIQLAARESHEASEEWDVFRFPKVLIISLRVAAFVPGLLGLLIYHSFSNPGILEMTVLAGIFGLMTLIVVAMLAQVSTFSVAVSKQCLKLNERLHRRTIDFSAVREVVIALPWRANGRLDLIGVDERRLCRIDGGIQDFDELVKLVKLYCPDRVKIREKDTHGRWTKR
ncbi:MAG: hypothetical protein JWL65_961 [Gammaproteobacteria bacterium]|nr:hypothetical protein [Gammaproteobacteria bacterium]